VGDKKCRKNEGERLTLPLKVLEQMLLGWEKMSSKKIFGYVPNHNIIFVVERLGRNFLFAKTKAMKL
jgi:hypothetical protein